ncbi:MAG: biotin attachment protein, partial [Proteobacteria bacterium]|nr:biotin attachment protein [Pseudomonadota bacterium]
GRTPVKPDPEIVKIAEKQMGMPVFDGDPLDVLEPGIPKAVKILEKEGLPVTDENIFILGALATPGGNKGLDFLKGDRPVNCRKITDKIESEKKAAPKQQPVSGPAGLSQYKVTVDGTVYQVMVEDETGEVAAVRAMKAGETPKRPPVEIRTQLPGNVYEILCAVGDSVKKGETMVILEAMKMETPIVASDDGIIESLEVTKGQTVQSGQLIAVLA